MSGLEAQTINVTALDTDAGSRLDVFLSRQCSISRSVAQQWLADGLVEINGRPAGKSARLQTGDSIAVTVPPVRPASVEAQDIPLNIVYEDSHLLVVNKPKGIVVHPAAGNYENTLVNALLFHCGASLSGIGGEVRPGIVHRIDKDTSGLLVVAKDDVTHGGLAGQFAAHTILREYHAVVQGHMPGLSGRIDAAIGRSAADRKKMAVTSRNSKHAVTHYRVLADYPGFSYLSLKLETGRTHQIRVHMADMGHPLAGDFVYGAARTPRQRKLQGQCLHAKLLGFCHPVTGETLRFDSELPAYFTDFLADIREGETR